MSATPPTFAEDVKCKACNVKFTLTTRRHHCRSCGGSFCGPCSSNRDDLFHFGLPQPERTCDACHRYLRSVSPTATACAYTIPHYLSTIGGTQKYQHTPEQPHIVTFSPFPAADAQYEGSNAEQCREAIKCNDLSAVLRLLEAKIDPSYIDKTGNTLLHLACIMDKFPIIKALCDAGANPYQPNKLSQAETAYDVASAAVKFKFRTLYPAENYGTTAPAPPKTRKKAKKVKPEEDSLLGADTVVSTPAPVQPE